MTYRGTVIVLLSFIVSNWYMASRWRLSQRRVRENGGSAIVESTAQRCLNCIRVVKH